MRIKTKYVIAGVVILIGAVLYYFWYLGGKTEAYDDIPDLGNAYAATDEIKTAETKLQQGVTPATVSTRNPDKPGIVLTFDGLPEPAVAAKLSDLLTTYDRDAVFFVEGSNAAGDKDTVLTLKKNKHITIENYTYSGVTKLETLPQDAALRQLVQTQKVLSTLTDTTPTAFKGPNASYVVPLLETAAAAGLQSAVKTDVYVKRDALTSDAAADAFVASLPQGSIVSLVVNTPVNTIVYESGKTDEKPAKDKQPNLKLRTIDASSHEDLVVVTERLLKALARRQVPSLKLTDLRQIKRADTPAAPSQPVALAQQVLRRLSAAFVPVAYAAEPQVPTVVTLPTEAKPEAPVVPVTPVTTTMPAPPKMIYTTEPAVAFAFAGLTKPQVVHETLDYLQQNKARGTFFVMANEIKTNPKLVKDIIHSGNEVAIGIRSLKNSNYESTKQELTYVKNQLQCLGVTTNLAMQPWGKLTADTQRAAHDLGLTLYAPTVNIVSSKQQHYTDADAVMQERFGKFTYSVGRGWIVYFRLDYYDDDSLAVKVMDLVKRHKIDNIAYHSFYDDPATNPYNDSAYRITSIGDILSQRDKLYTIDTTKAYPTDGTAYKVSRNLSFNDFIYDRYIGNKAVEDDNMFGFSVEEKRYCDLTGLIHTDQPVVFFTFDDFGNDAAINHLLYVFRKHHAKGTFFVLTHNVMYNPNIVRAIAAEGHDLASHSDQHRPMDGTAYPKAYTQYLVDYGTAAAKLRDITQGLRSPDGSPAYKPFFRPPTLTASKAGFRVLYDTGYDYIVSGSYSTHDYEQPSLQAMIEDIQAGIFDDHGHVIKGAVLIMHMSDGSLYTPIALDILMTMNDQRPDGDPAKFIPVPLSAYLKNGYHQGR